MFENISREQLLRIVSALFMLGAIFGVNTMDIGVSEEQVADSLVTLIAAVGIVSDVIGYFLRWSKGDVTLGGFRK
jgi:uncharacterized membrane protein